MSRDFSYVHLFDIMFSVLKDKTELIASCPKCPNCIYLKKVRVYFKLLKDCVDKRQKEKYIKILDRFVQEEDWFCDSFIYSVIVSVDEDVMMEEVYDEKETISNELYLKKCNTLMSIKKFRAMMNEEYDFKNSHA
jgi:hypothetical protein